MPSGREGGSAPVADEDEWGPEEGVAEALGPGAGSGWGPLRGLDDVPKRRRLGSLWRCPAPHDLDLGQP